MNGDSEYVSYPVFRGLQRPLEIMGLKGRYIGWAVGTIGAGFVSFLITYFTINFFAGLLAVLITIAAGAALIMIKSRKGLHSKKEYNGTYVYIHNKGL